MTKQEQDDLKPDTTRLLSKVIAKVINGRTAAEMAASPDFVSDENARQRLNDLSRKIKGGSTPSIG